uniref:NB-ARC domain-containing protein n=1 Tax=Leersia perrieri TaxID=77586 RepID=A0A0D9WPY4_9ORYZ
MAEGVVGLLIVKLGDALASEAVEIAKSMLGLEGSSLKRLFSEIREVKGELESIHAFLQAADRFRDYSDETTSMFVKQIRSLAFGIEDVGDEFTYKIGEGGGRMSLKRMCKISTWSRLAGNLQDIKISLKSAAKRRIRYDLKDVVESGAKSMPRRSSNWRSDSAHFKSEDELVGIDKNRELLMRWMKDEQQQHRIVSVWGMGGIGKTALVANVYNAIKDDFDTCAWITVSQSYEPDDLLRRAVQEFRKNDRKKDFPIDIDISNYRRLVETIRFYLENKRYVLVLDDVWSTNVWFDSKDAFGGGNVTGRIILTSRNYDVALLAPETHIINLHPLVRSHAWDLFCKEAFWKNENRNCPPELLHWAQSFVDKCHGLPIAIVCIARLLSFQGSTHSDWEKVNKNLEMQLTNNSVMDMMNLILKISLEDLPHNIKNCFLYCSMFPEKFAMKTKLMVRLWVVEGFVEETEQETPENTAEHYLTELVNRCLLLVVRRNESGRIKEFQMHDVLRVLALSKAREQQFCIAFNHTSTNLIGEARRLSVQRGDIAEIAGHTPHLRSLLLFQNSPTTASLRSISRSIKLLSVLDLTDSSIDMLPEEAFGLFNLRLLGLRRTKINKLPRSIGRLKNLLVLDAFKSKIVKLPLEITKLRKLTHLIVTSKPVVGSLQFVPSAGVPAPIGICSLTSLRTLHMMEASSEMVHHLGALVQMRTFGISKVQSCHCEHLFPSITNMIHLTRLGIQADSSQELLHLEALKSPPLLQKLFLEGALSQESLPHFMSVSNLNNLRSLRLVGSRLDENAFLNLESLQQLVKLQLYDAYDGKNIYFHENSFPKLRVLSIRGATQLSEIKMKKGAVASLADLKLLLCPKLKQLPYGIEHVSTLEELTLDNTAEELVNKVRQKTERIISHVQRVYVGFSRNGVLAAERIQ